MKTLIKNGTVVTGGKSFRADVLVSGETIERVGTDLCTEADRVIDAEGCYVMAGFIGSSFRSVGNGGAGRAAGMNRHPYCGMPCASEFDFNKTPL